MKSKSIGSEKLGTESPVVPAPSMPFLQLKLMIKFDNGTNQDGTEEKDGNKTYH